MERLHFDQEIKRLLSQWPHSYGAERLALIWITFKDVSNFDFRDAITDCLCTCRSAPLIDDLSKSVQKAKNHYFERERIKSADSIGYLEGLSQENKMCDPEFVLRCLKHLNDFHEEKIIKEVFSAGCDVLDQIADQINPKGKRRILF